MEVLTIAQVVALILGVLGIIWHQQHNTDRLRSEFRSDIGDLRTEMRAEIGELRSEMRSEIGELRTDVRAEIGELRTEVVAVGQRVARIEGFLRIGSAPTSAEEVAESSVVESPS